MIKPHSEDPDVEQAAKTAGYMVDEILTGMPKAASFDYGGHVLKIGDYGVCMACTVPIAEAQAAERAIREKADDTEDETIKEHLELAAKLFHLEAEAATVRAELHNGLGTEEILNRLLGYEYERHIGEDFHHSHHGGES